MIDLSFSEKTTQYALQIQRHEPTDQQEPYTIIFKSPATSEANFEKISSLINRIFSLDSSFNTLYHSLSTHGFSNISVYDHLSTEFYALTDFLFTLEEEIVKYTLSTSHIILTDAILQLNLLVEKTEKIHKRYLSLQANEPDSYLIISSCNHLISRTRYILKMEPSKTTPCEELLQETVYTLRGIHTLQLNYTDWFKKCCKIDIDYPLSFDVALLSPLMSSRNSLNIPRLAGIYPKNQQDYSNLMHTFIHLGTIYKKKYAFSFYPMLAFFSYARKQMSNNSSISSHGNPREFEMSTDLIIIYEDIGDKIFAKYHLTEKIYCVIEGVINEKIIRLSKINLLTNKLFHTKLKHVPTILDHVEKIYKEAEASTNKDEVFYLSGKIFWWICQAKPWKLGDPSIAEMLLRSLWEEKGFQNPSWNPSIIPWSEVCIEFNVETFAQNFHTLFQL